MALLSRNGAAAFGERAVLYVLITIVVLGAVIVGFAAARGSPVID